MSPAEHRYLMTVIATASNPRFWVSRVDIDRAGPTYTIDTIRDIAVQRPGAELYFITGADALAQILSWKDAEDALKLAQFVGVTRPGYELSDAHLPQRLGHPARRAGDGDLVQRLPRPRRGRATGLVPRPGRRRAVHQQAPTSTAADRRLGRRDRNRRGRRARAASLAQAAADKLATDIVLIDVSERLAITDVFVIATGSNERQVEAIVDAVEEKLRRHGHKPIRREGRRDGRWVLLDYGDIVVHVQHAEERVFYALERLWKDCPFIPFTDAARHGAAAPAGSAGVSSRRVLLLRHGRTAWNAAAPLPGPGRPAAGRGRPGAGLRGRGDRRRAAPGSAGQLRRRARDADRARSSARSPGCRCWPSRGCASAGSATGRG